MKKSIYFIMACMTAFSMSCKQADKPGKGIDLANLDTTAKPQADFYQYACGGWMKNHPLKPEYSRFGSFDKLAEDNKQQLKDLITGLASKEQAKGSVAAKIGGLYKIGMDTVKLEKDGFTPVKPHLDAIKAIKDLKGVQQEIISMHKQYIMPFFFIDISADQMNSKMNILNMYQGGLGMPDRDYYLVNDAREKEIRSQYLLHIEKMFTLAGYEPKLSASYAQKILKLETGLAKASLSREALRDPVANYKKMTVEELVKTAPNFDWKGYLNGVGAGAAKDLNVSQLSFIKSMDSLFKVTPVEDLKAYLAWNVLNESADYLNAAAEKQNFEFFGKVLTGKEEQKARWKRVVEVINGTLGEAVGQLYVEKYFPKEAKEKMLKLVDNLRASLGERISGLAWMSDETKKKAHEKLNAITVKIGYPDKWRDYSALEIKDDSYYNNIQRSSEFEFNFKMNKLGKPVDRTEWGMTPQTVNAYYDPTVNEIVFPAGILQPPFFNFEADDAVNYGAIGVVIGHEMTHGFDDQGRQYDKEGNLKDWWTADDAKKFNERTTVLVNYFNNIKVLDTVHANGSFTLGENIADQGGLQVSFNALMKAMKEKPAPEKIDGFTQQQRFFLSYANVWANNIRDKEILRRTKVDPHSLGKWRVNGALPHIPAFVEAFNIKEGDAMFVKPENRVSIW